jgi:predicted GNAT superfamily acetyltransferase
MMLAKAHISGEWFNATVDDAVIAVERAAIAASQTITPVGLRPTGKAMRRNSFSGATPMVGIRLATNLRDFLEQEADKENRSLSNMIMHALLEWMQERGYSVTDHLSHPR